MADPAEHPSGPHPPVVVALRNLVAMVEENGPDYADADAMRDARAALGVGVHHVIELASEGYRPSEHPSELHPSGSPQTEAGRDLIERTSMAASTLDSILRERGIEGYDLRDWAPQRAEVVAIEREAAARREPLDVEPPRCGCPRCEEHDAASRPIPAREEE